LKVLQESTVDLASLWYTAWVNAGLTGGVASVDDNAEPTGYGLAQNYPNPFNPVTVIKYTISGAGGRGPGASRTSLIVYDMLGRQVATLVDEVRVPGTYEVRFDGNGLASGAYIYRLTAESFIQARTMILVK
jgi:hypothetical protein